MKKHLKKLCICLAAIGIAHAAYFTMSQPAYAYEASLLSLGDELTTTLDFMDGMAADDDLAAGDNLVWCGAKSTGCTQQPDNYHTGFKCTGGEHPKRCAETGTTKGKDGNPGQTCQCCRQVVQDDGSLVTCNRIPKKTDGK